MRVKAVLHPRRTEDWETIEIVAYVNDYKECQDGFGEYIDFDVESVYIIREDGSAIEDLSIEDVQDLMNEFEYEILEAIIAEEYLSGSEHVGE